MSTQMEIGDVKNRFAELLDRARSGEEIVLADGGKPVVRIAPAVASANARVFGDFAGKIKMSDDFIAPLAGKDLAEWER